MHLQQLNRGDADKVFISVRNSTATQLSAGYLVVFNVRNAASANGVDVEQPVTSGLPAFAGVVNDLVFKSTYAIGSQGTTGENIGLVQVYGYSMAYTSASGGETLAPGQVIGPITGAYYANSAGASTANSPIIVLSQKAGGLSLNPVFIRAM